MLKLLRKSVTNPITLFQAMSNFEGTHIDSRRSGGMESVLQSLHRATNYSITVRARTAAGAGPSSDPINCITHEDSEFFIP